jgi:hypothetical protein
MKLNDVKMLAQPYQTREIQRIIWNQGGHWDNKIKTSDYLYVYKNQMSWCDKNFNAELVDADEWIREYNKEWFSKRTIFNLEKYVLSGAPVPVLKSEFEYIKYLEANNYEITYEGKTGYTMSLIQKQQEDYVKDTAEIKPGTIVLATRKSNSDKSNDYNWQGTYFGYCNGKHLIDANGTNVQLADDIAHIPTLTKKEAKQKISELFSNTKNVTSEQVRNIIDLIKD